MLLFARISMIRRRVWPFVERVTLFEIMLWKKAIKSVFYTAHHCEMS
jgi:hypothetical protein